MFTFSYKFCDHATYLQKLASFIGVPLLNNVLWLPVEIGSGYIKSIQLANGLQVLVNECVIHNNVCIRREGGSHGDYTLRFDEIRNMKALTLKMDEAVHKENNGVYSGALLTSSFSPLEYTATAGTENRCINIHFTEEWFNKYCGLKGSDYVLTKYLALKTGAFNFEVLNIGYRELMEEIFALKEDHPIYKTVLQNRVMLLLENFLGSLYTKMSKPNAEINIEDGEIKRMMQVESILISNLSMPPPPLSELARTAIMSVTKLKAVFKKTYGLSPYEYYQTNRMLKARQLLNNGKYSIKEIGTQLGFKNLSNFTIAYKKAFNILPRDV
ncbi:MAG: AraC family transcriptional regulator [Ferruginibacter sp.]